MKPAAENSGVLGANLDVNLGETAFGCRSKIKCNLGQIGPVVFGYGRGYWKDGIMCEEAKTKMTESEMAMRKFLKQLGVTGHQKLSDALKEAVRSGKLAEGNDIAVRAKIEIVALGFSHDVVATLKAPGRDGH